MRKKGKGRAPCCEKHGLRKGSWTEAEDTMLVTYILLHGHRNWNALPKQAGLLRCGKSCRLRWTNYLRPDIKRGNFSKEEEDTIIQLHQLLGNKWSTIASRLPGRTDNEIKNVWNTHLKKRLSSTSPSSTSSASCNPTKNIESDISVDDVNIYLDMEGGGVSDVVDGVDVFETPAEVMANDLDIWVNIDMLDDQYSHINHSNTTDMDRDKDRKPNNNSAPDQQPHVPGETMKDSIWSPQIVMPSELTEDNINAAWIQYLERELDLVD